MSAPRRLPRMPLLLGAVGISVAAVCRDSTRERVTKALGISAPGGIWRLLTILLVFVNIKNMPFIWHFRLFRSLIYHLFFQPTEITPRDLFKPVVQITHTPISETDYNFHKSNSTYFTDLDIARTHLATAILRKGIRGIKDERGATFSFRNTSRAAGHTKQHSANIQGNGRAADSDTGAKGMTEEDWYARATQPGPLLIALGAVTCQFHHEIPPYMRYEVWTRLLTWDRKWLYIVSHFVERGAFKPTGYSLQPNRKGSAKIENLTEEDRARLKKKIFASSMAKYVVKKGRLTIPPELVLERSQMLPARPEGVPVLGGWTPSHSQGATPEQTVPPSPEPEVDSSTAASEDCGNGFLEPSQATLENSFFTTTDVTMDDADEWTWESVQARRLKGLRLAEAFDSLDGLKDSFQLDKEEALGQYADLIFNF